MGIFICAYFVIGAILSSYWFSTYYSNLYEEAKKEGNVEKGAAGLLMLFLCILWPIKLFKRFVSNRNSSDG